MPLSSATFKLVKVLLCGMESFSGAIMLRSRLARTSSLKIELTSLPPQVRMSKSEIMPSLAPMSLSMHARLNLSDMSVWDPLCMQVPRLKAMLSLLQVRKSLPIQQCHLDKFGLVHQLNTFVILLRKRNISFTNTRLRCSKWLISTVKKLRRLSEKS